MVVRMRAVRALALGVVLLILTLNAMPPAKAYTKAVGFNIARTVVENLPPEWREVFSTYYNLIDSSIAEVHDTYRNASYNPETDVGLLMVEALNHYSAFIKRLDEKRFPQATEELGRFVFFVTELANPVRVSKNFSKEMVVKWDSLVSKKIFKVSLGGAEEVSDVKESLRGLALEAAKYSDRALQAIREGEIDSEFKEVLEGLLSRAATVSYSLVLKALNTHFSNMLPYALAWITGSLAVGIALLNYRWVVRRVKKIRRR